MRSFSIVTLLGLVAAQGSDCTSCSGSSSTPVQSSASVASSTPVAASSSLVGVSSSLAASSSPSPTPSAAITAITVAKDGSGQFTAINAAVNAAQISGIPTVTISPGTYSEAIVISGTATVTLVGATSAPAADWSQNQVTVSFASSPLSINTNAIKGLTVRNINFINPVAAASGTTVVAALRGANVAFYGCSLVSAGQGAVTASFGIALFANSYIEGTDKLFYNVPTIYVYQSTIVPTASNALIVYNKGATSGTTFYNSTVVVDSSNVQQKSGLTNTNVYMGAPNGNGVVVIFRNSVLGAFMAAAGVHPAAANTATFYGEYQNTGPGSYSKNAATRASYDVLLSPDTVAQFTIDKVFANNPFGSSSVSWIQQSVVDSIQAGYAVQPVASVSSAAPTSSAAVSSSSSAVVSSSASLSSAVSSSLASSSDYSASSSASLVSSSSISAISSQSSSVSADPSSSGSIPSSIISSSVSAVSSSTVVSSSASASSSIACAATPSSATFVVSKTPGPCEYGSVSAAILALPNDSKPYTIQIGPGSYVEQLNVQRNGKVTLIGATNFKNDYTQNQVRISFSKGSLTGAGQNEQTTVLYAKKANDNSGFAVYNIDFVNTYPQTYDTAALAADFYGANIAAYGCSFIGFQDTLLVNKGTQVFSNCYIEGSVDFIWGYSTAYFYQCMIVSNTPGAFITAQNRPSATAAGGFVFDTCMVTYNSAYGSNFGTTSLGRPWSQFAIAVYMNSYLDKHISAAGWSVWSNSNPQTSGVMFGEYNNAGPGSWQSGRATFATQLTPAQADGYKLASLIGDTTWIDMATYNLAPSYSLTGPTTPIVPPTNSTLPTNGTTPTTNSTSAVIAHPKSGTVPPVGAVIVDVKGANNAKFTTISAALASLPNDNTDQIIFVYPGSYNEQIAPVNRPGAVQILGYTTGNPGQSYQGNQVTITFSRGLSVVAPIPAGHTNAETAVFATASTKISLYNINMINTDNLDGATPSYVTLAASIYGDKIAFYGCSFDGWQDTLLTGATAGYQYYESCYIGGAIDFIWGYSKAYFKGCTLGAKRKGSAVTAHNRASSSAIGGYIFDQCLFTAAPGAVDGLNGVFLGRPYSQYALVVVKNSYIDSVISPSGWKVWSATDPRTGGVTFAEFNNSGPSNWENNVAARQAFGFATLLTSDSYSLPSVMTSTDWIDMTYWNTITTPAPLVTPVIPPGNVTVNGTSVFNGTAPPAGALIVSKSPITGVTTYSTIQDAMNAASTSSKINATIFIYPGVYEEQLIVNKSGHTIFQGYSTSTDDYSKNQVTIQFSRGIDTQGTGGSNTDGATVYAKGNYFHAYNINFRNNFGTQQNMASLGFAVQSSKYAGLYGCQIYGNQDTLSVSGNLFTFKTYIEGNVDFIYGSGSAYFLASTISPNEDGISITAHKRATNTTNAGFVFDQCTIKPAAGLGPFKNVGLGRPWNNLARVAYVNCYYDAMISAAGWNPWSKSSPNTNGVQFGEYHNFGPGAGICGRASFSSQLSDADVAQYKLGSFFGSANFIDYSRVDTQPFNVGIGSAQICATISSSVSPTPSSTLSLRPTSSSLPVVTVYSTVISTVTPSAVTTTSLLKLTQTVSEFASDVLKTSVVKQTATTTVTSPDVTSTSTDVVTKDVGLTIVPVPVTKTTVVKSTVTVLSTSTEAAKTTTVKTTTTVVQLSTSTPKAFTTTTTTGSTRTITSTVTPKPVETTVKTTTSIQPTSTKTSTVEQADVTVHSTSTKTTTKKTTTTLACIPTQNLVRRGAVIPRALGSTTTLTVTTTATLPVSTVVITQSAIATTKSVVVKGSTITVMVTSIVKTSTVEQQGTTQLTTTTITSEIGKTTTLKPSTVTVSSTSLATSTSVTTLEAQDATVTNFNTKYTTQTIVVPQQTVVVTKSIDEAITIKSTLPVSTLTEYDTVTIGQRVTTVTVTAPPSTKTSVQKTTSTVFSTATKTAKGAKQC